jgi:LmbE family N-acetylglucosaminyl deacetylase
MMIQRLVVAPHCDDETLGCGGLLAKYPNESAVVVVSQPDDVRFREFKAAQAALGYVESFIIGMPDGAVGDNMHALVGALDEVVAKYQPQEMYLPFPSTHQDHIATYEAGVRAGRLSMTPGHHFTPSMYVYDVAAYDVNLYPSHLNWNVFESITEEHIDAKVRALQCYSSQAVTGPHPVNSMKQQAGVLGASRQVEWAEQYALIRKVRA